MFFNLHYSSLTITPAITQEPRTQIFYSLGGREADTSCPFKVENNVNYEFN